MELTVNAGDHSKQQMIDYHRIKQISKQIHWNKYVHVQEYVLQRQPMATRWAKLINQTNTQSLLNLNCKVKCYPQYNVPLAPSKSTYQRARSLVGRDTFISEFVFCIDQYYFCNRLVIRAAIFINLNLKELLQTFKQQLYNQLICFFPFSYNRCFQFINLFNLICQLNTTKQIFAQKVYNHKYLLIYRFTMTKNLFIGIIIFSILISVSTFQFKTIRFPKKIQKQQVQELPTQNCNITHFQFQSNVSLGKNDELNRTFGKLGEKITSLNNVTWKKNDSTSYFIYEANPTFYYRDSKQKAQIVGNDSIVIDGGFAQVSIDFKWSKFGPNPKYGTGSVRGLSDQCVFAKQIVIEGDFFRYKLLDYINITYSNPLEFTRISPPQTTDQQKKDVLSLINNIINVTTIRHQLQEQIALYYTFILSMNLHDQSMPINQHFEYKWTSPVASKGSLIIPFTRRPDFVDIQKDGIHYGYQARIDGDTNWKCGPGAPRIPMNDKVYGGSQQFISYDFYSNVLRYAIQKGQIDTSLSRDIWQSKMFQFYAGDLYDIFPKVAETFYASTEVTGDCKTNSSQVKLYQAGKDTFNVTIHSKCQLNINRTKILDFDVGLELEVQGKANYSSLDFVLKSHSEFVTYYEYNGWKMQNKVLADQIVRHCLNRLYENNLFGSGWPLHPERDYPHFESQINASFVYDSTHV